MFTVNSRIKDIYAHPIGCDLIRKLLLQMGRRDTIIKNPIIGSIKLKTLIRFSMGKVDEGFLSAFFDILNREQDTPCTDACSMTAAWWKEAVFYQVYPRSFKDSNGDGIGDLPGILEKLTYLKMLGVDAIWLSPIYDSPNDDNGYDIRDYRKIMTEFGTMEDFDKLLDGIHSRGMKLIMDLVVNHTSDEHEWFKKALTEPDSKYGDYYIFRDKPNNWTSFFRGSAWKYYKERNQYALHLFSQKQMDLNWDNPDVRNDVKEMVCWWLDKGVDGFRMDVVNYISKREGLPDGNETIGKLIGFNGVEHFFYGPHLHEYLRELKIDAFSPYGAFTIGETPGIGLETSKLLTDDYRWELDMVFSFDQLDTNKHVRFDNYIYDLNYFKEYMIELMENLENHCQAALFYENHDNPRMISKIDTDPNSRDILAKLLATMQFTLKGTPFIYQGQELGMINSRFKSICDLRDVESLNLYEELRKTMSEKDAFSKICSGSRDNARTPMQWTSGKYAGFSDAEPWIAMDNDYLRCNTDEEISHKDSVWNYYRSLIELRKKYTAFVYGDIYIVNKKVKNLFTYYRLIQNEMFYIECNLSKKVIKRKDKLSEGLRIISNYPDISKTYLRPYESAVWMIRGPEI